jgi:hypothetical protein
MTTPGTEEAMNTARRMTEAELTAAADALLPTSDPLPPMAVSDVLGYLAAGTRDLQADLWTLRDALDAHLTGERHTSGIVAVAELAALLDDATNTVRALAAELNIALPPNLYGPASC